MAKMTQAQRKAEVASVDAYIEQRMQEIGKRLVEADRAGAYPDGIPQATHGRLLNMAMLNYGLVFPPAPMPGAE